MQGNTQLPYHFSHLHKYLVAHEDLFILGETKEFMKEKREYSAEVVTIVNRESGQRVKTLKVSEAKFFSIYMDKYLCAYNEKEAKMCVYSLLDFVLLGEFELDKNVIGKNSPFIHEKEVYFFDQETMCFVFLCQ